MYEFSTSEPVRLRIEFGSGEIKIDATDTTTSTVEIEPYRDDDASREAVDRTTVEQRGDEILIETPRKTGGSIFRRSAKIRARITVPTGSDIEAKIDSADLTARGQYGSVQVKTGSGDVRLETVDDEISVASGSGDVDVRLGGERTRIQAGSGDLSIRGSRGQVNLTTGSGDIRIDEAGDAVQATSGSGDVLIRTAEGDVTVSTASGDQRIRQVSRGRVRCNAASGDILIGIAEGTAAWLEVNSISGSVQSQLDGSEPPGEDEESVQVKANTVSGDIVLARA
ncbi:MAG TPA: DUF4097 family beta strand repeat-containing protein [Nocardioidaceae bacterium]|nr:DUF4097 family beta strand repeat-containing protein [Nocardioidaceae bacterium]